MKYLHNLFRRSIVKVENNKDINHMASLDTIKSKVDEVIAEVELVVEATGSTPEFQLVKDKLTDIKDFLSRVDTDSTPTPDGLPTPEVPTEPVIEPVTPVEVPVDPATGEPTTPTIVPVPDPVAPEAPAEDLNVPSTDVVTPDGTVVSPDPNAPVVDTTVVTPPVDGSEPVTDTDGNEVTDPNAPR